MRVIKPPRAAAFAVAWFSRPAAANNFCVPTYSADCPASGDQRSRTGPERGSGLAGRMATRRGIIAPAPDFHRQFHGNDPLEIIGSGRDKTFLTSSATGNTYVLDRLPAATGRSR